VARRLKIKWEGGKVAGLLDVPAEPNPIGILLAHGAGAGQEHPFMVHMRRGLAAAGFMTLSFNYAYIEAGRRAPDRMPKLLAVHAAAGERLGTYVDRIALVGKSMGGRVGSHLAGDGGWPAAALVYLGYPLVPLGRTEPRPTEHLQRIDSPQLFIAGSRDRLGPVAAIEETAAALPVAAVQVVQGADHGFAVPKSVGLTRQDVWDGLVAQIARWLPGR